MLQKALTKYKDERPVWASLNDYRKKYVIKKKCSYFYALYNVVKTIKVKVK